jgi:hypothetical protein
MDELTERQKDMLALERRWWVSGAVKTQAIRERFDLSPARFRRELDELVETDAAAAYDPLLVLRLRRTRGLAAGISRHPAGRWLG